MFQDLQVDPNRRYVAEAIVLLTSLGAKRVELNDGKRACDLLEIKHGHRKVLDLNRDVSGANELDEMVESAVARLLARKQLVKNIDDRSDLCLPQIFIDGCFAGDFHGLQGLEDDGLLGRILRREICVKCYFERKGAGQLCKNCGITFEEILPDIMTINDAEIVDDRGDITGVIDEDCASGSDERYEAYTKRFLQKKFGFTVAKGGVARMTQRFAKGASFSQDEDEGEVSGGKNAYADALAEIRGTQAPEATKRRSSRLEPSQQRRASVQGETVKSAGESRADLEEPALEPKKKAEEPEELAPEPKKKATFAGEDPEEKPAPEPEEKTAEVEDPAPEPKKKATFAVEDPEEKPAPEPEETPASEAEATPAAEPIASSARARVVSEPLFSDGQDELEMSEGTLETSEPEPRSVGENGSVVDLPDATLQSGDASNEEHELPVSQMSSRHRCPHGMDCCRKNPDHKKEFAHVDDDDWQEAIENLEGAPEGGRSRARTRSRLRSDALAENPRRTDMDVQASVAPPAIQGYMYKRSPNLLTFRHMHWRFVVVEDGHMAWWKTENEAIKSLKKPESARGFVNLSAGDMVLELEHGNETTFQLLPKSGTWPAGVVPEAHKKELGFTFDSSKSAHRREQWTGAIWKHIQDAQGNLELHLGHDA